MRIEIDGFACLMGRWVIVGGSYEWWRRSRRARSSGCAAFGAVGCLLLPFFLYYDTVKQEEEELNDGQILWLECKISE